MRITVDRSRCQGIGMCEGLRPDVFEIDDAGELVVHDEAVTAAARADLEAAVDACPTLALGLAD